MFDIGWTELLLIGIVSLIVIGPKDLPGMFRTLGRFTAKIRAMGREFQRAMEAAADESGVKDVASDLRRATNPGQMGLDALKDAAKSLDPRTTARKATASGAAAATSAATGAATGATAGTPPGPAASTAQPAGPSGAGAAAAGAAVAAASGVTGSGTLPSAGDDPGAVSEPDPLAFPPSPEDDRT